ncbi:MAG TPA: toll/interleukin-1 receptor domain-containing protein [Chitinophagales bacterium]|nr:toll/interleukin-1 receptor domain-containing protein [Chitinophagales bacterium]
MNVFISWSGKLSHQIALVLKEHLPQIINVLEPFVSSEDIKKGDNWNSTISKKLNASDFGILCLTKENLESPWLLFEAGALSKNIDKARVCSVLFDNLKQSEVKTPLSLFQTTKFEKEDFKKLFNSINDALGEKKLNDNILEKSFQKWWPDLKEHIDKVTNEYFPQIKRQEEEKSDRLDEILMTTKYISKVVSRFNYNLPQDSLDLAKYNDETEPIIFAGLENNHPVRVIVDPVNKTDGTLCRIEITKIGVLELPSINNGRGVNIELLFNSEHGGFWNMDLGFHKGDTFMSTNKVDLDEETAKKLSFNTIWRD